MRRASRRLADAGGRLIRSVWGTDLPGRLLAIGEAYLRLYLRGRDASDLDQAIRHFKAAVANTPEDHRDRVDQLFGLGDALLCGFDVTREASDLVGAVTAYEKALAARRLRPATAGRDGTPLAPHIMRNLGLALCYRASLTGDRADLDRAIDLSRQALGSETAADSGEFALDVLSNLLGALLARYRMTGDRADLDAAIEAGDRAERSREDGEPADAALLLNRGSAYHNRFLLARDPVDLDAAIELASAGVGGSDPAEPDFTARLAGLRDALRDRYDLTGQRADLQAAIAVGEQALAAARREDERRTCLFRLATALLARHEFTGDLADAEVAANLLLDAVSAAGPDPSPARLTGTRGQALRLLARHRGSHELIELALNAGREAVAAAPDDERADWLSELSLATAECYMLRGDLASLEEAVRLSRQAADAAPAGSAKQARWLCNTASFLRELAVHTGDLAVLREAVRLSRAAAASEAAARSSGMIQHVLAIVLYDLFVREQDADLLREAVRAMRRAVDGTPADSPQRALCLNDLRKLLWELHERTGEASLAAEAGLAGREAVLLPSSMAEGRMLSMGDFMLSMEGFSSMLEESSGPSTARRLLEEAAGLGRDAIEALPPGHPDRVQHLNLLGSVLLRIYEMTGEKAVISEAIETCRDALAEIPVGHAYRASRMAGLARALERLGVRTADREALRESVDLFRQAAEARDERAADFYSYLADLSRALHRWFEVSGDEQALREAVDAGRRAVRAAPRTGREAVVVFTRLALPLQDLVELTREPQVMAELVSVCGAAEAAIADDYLGHPIASRLGDALMLRFYGFSHDPQDLAEAQRCYARVASSPQRDVGTRILSYEVFATIGRDLPDCTPGQCLAALEEAIELLPLTAGRHLARADRERGIAGLSGLPAQAAAAALAAGRPARAVELLEASRGVLVADALDARSSDLGRLRNVNGDLADRFAGIRARIEELDRLAAAEFSEIPGVISPDGDGLSRSAWLAAADLTGRRRQAYADFDAVLAEIRAHPELAGFMRPPRAEWLAAQAADGPIVYLTAYEDRCDALILRDGRDDPVTHVPITAGGGGEAERRAEQFLRALGSALDPEADADQLASAEAEVSEVLAWLWDAIAEPVLTELGHTGPPAAGEPWPRVWWCPVGRLAVLPLHAAGRHQPPAAGAARPAVLDRVVSSYTTTVRALAYARDQAATASAGQPRMLIVAATGGDELPRLPAADDEVRQLADRFRDADLLRHPGRDAVRAALPGRAIAHFACHGVADWADPGASRLIVGDAQSASLTVRDVSALQLTDARLAYLSACETSISSPDLADEAVHVSAAFQLAGYQNVIGSLWPVRDDVASQVSARFYGGLTSGWTRPCDTSRTALAAHEAIRAARDAEPEFPIHWAPFVHVGT